MIESVYTKIDAFLTLLKSEGSGSIFDLGDLDHSETQIAKNLLTEHNLISFQKGYASIDSLIDITVHGLSVLEQGGIKAFLEGKNRKQKINEEREGLELEKLNAEIIDLRNKIFDFESAKSRTIRSEWVAWIGLILSATAVIASFIGNK